MRFLTRLKQDQNTSNTHNDMQRKNKSLHEFLLTTRHNPAARQKKGYTGLTSRKRRATIR